MPLPERQWNVTNDDVDRVRFVLVEDAYDVQLGPVREDRILLMVRRHWMYVVLRVAIPVLLGVAFLLLSIVIGTVRLHVPWGNLPDAQKAPTARQFTFVWTWWASLLLSAVCFLSAAVLALRWKYTYLLVTNWNVVVAWVPPVLFPWLQPLTPRLKLLAIDTADNDNPMLGRWLQYGTIIVDSPATKDQKNFGEMRWWPYHRKIIELIQAAIMNATVRNRSPFLP
ncbi:MAG TPA: hypothetical protein VHD60_02485 [Candidatus Saccharimonadales bacterium]|nr:hypothetical protein [Candidatus Saccharimonadales bacterium]